jgi:hypothetical protein
MNFVTAHKQWEVTVMWMEAKMKCDEVTANLMEHKQFFSLLPIKDEARCVFQ